LNEEGFVGLTRQIFAMKIARSGYKRVKEIGERLKCLRKSMGGEEECI
jgi:hypothetical protein